MSGTKKKPSGQSNIKPETPRDWSRTIKIILTLGNLLVWGILALIMLTGCSVATGEASQTHQPFVTMCFLARCDATAQDRAAQAEDSDVDVKQEGTQETEADLAGDTDATVKVPLVN